MGHILDCISDTDTTKKLYDFGYSIEEHTESLHHGDQIFGVRQAVLQHFTWNPKTREENSVQRKSTMDSHHTFHFLGLLPNPTFWHHELRLRWSFLLDPCYSGLKSWHTHGIGYFTHRNLRSHHAAFSR